MAEVRDLMRRMDKRIYGSRIVHSILRFGTSELQGAFFSKPREVLVAGVGIQGVGISFECQYDDDIATLASLDEVTVDDYGTLLFRRELQPGGDESGKTIIELAEP